MARRRSASRPLAAGALLALSLGSACAFLTDFPEVEGLDATSTGEPASSSASSSADGSTTSSATGSTSTGDGGGGSSGDGGSGNSVGGSGGEGGSGGGVGPTSTSVASSASSSTGGACDEVEGCETCRNCFPCDEACPTDGASFVGRSDPSNPDDRDPMGPATSVWLNDGVRLANQPFRALVLGHLGDRGGGGTLDLDNQPLLNPGTSAAGFVVDESGELFLAARGCSATGSATDEVFFNAITRTDSGNVVIAGAFEAGRLHFFGRSGPPASCDETDSRIEGPDPDNTSFQVPFLAWFDESAQMQKTLEPLAGQTQVGYFADVAAMPGGGDRVVALGVGSGSPFSAIGDPLNDAQYFLISTPGEQDEEVFGFDTMPCADAFSLLSGFESAVAVDVDGQVWVAGTGCPLGQPSADDRSFLARFATDVDGEILDPPQRAFWGGGSENPMSITELAVTETHVVVAGSFDGSPEVADVPVDTGTDDGFVMAFLRDGWSNTQALEWFVRVDSAGPARVMDLAIDGGKVFITGSVADAAAVDDVVACSMSNPLPEGRAFVAQLSLESGDADWVRLEGFASGEAQAGSFSHGRVVVPGNGVLLTGTRAHGELELVCGGGEPATPNQPLISVEVLDLP